MSKAKKSNVNYEKRSVPSTPGSMQITVQGQKSMKGGAEFVSPLPKKNIIPGGGK